MGKVVFYGGTLVVFTMVLHQLGFQLAALLGALGIAGVAVGAAIWRNWSWGRCDWRRGGVTFRRDVFVSYPDQVLVMQIEANRPGAVSMSASPPSWQFCTSHLSW